MNNCAPGKYDAENKTCFCIKELKYLIGLYNKFAESQNMPEKIIKIDDRSKRELLLDLYSRFKNICGGGSHCLSEQELMYEILKMGKVDKNFKPNKIFRPKGPYDSNKWLTNLNIDDVLKAYTNIFPELKFINAVPLDCQDYKMCSLYNLDFEKLYKKGKRKIGIIFNLDRVHESGSHWVGLYMNMDHNNNNDDENINNYPIAFFFDPVGNPPKTEIMRVINQFKKFIKNKMNIEAKYEYLNKKIQNDRSECGVYCTSIMIRCIMGHTPEEIKNNNLDYKEITKCRKIYFYNNDNDIQVSRLCDPTIDFI